ncbi:hypothetical protein D3C78_1625840 [compost metagenome]
MDLARSLEAISPVYRWQGGGHAAKRAEVHFDDQLENRGDGSTALSGGGPHRLVGVELAVGRQQYACLGSGYWVYSGDTGLGLDCQCQRSKGGAQGARTGVRVA